jgi:hypothetical protein
VYPTDLVQLEVREGSGNGTLGIGMRDTSGGLPPTERPVTVEREV